MKNTFIFSVIATILLQSSIFAEDAKIYEWGSLTNNIQMSISLANGSNDIKLGEPVAGSMNKGQNYFNVVSNPLHVTVVPSK